MGTSAPAQVEKLKLEGHIRLVPANAELWANLDVRYPAYDATELLDALPHHLYIDQHWFTLTIKKDFQGRDSADQPDEIGPFYKVGEWPTFVRNVPSSHF